MEKKVVEKKVWVTPVLIELNVEGTESGIDLTQLESTSTPVTQWVPFS